MEETTNQEQQGKEKPKKDNEVKLKELELWGKAIDMIAPIIDYYQNKLAKHDAPIAKSTIWAFIIIIGIILISSTALLACDKIDKSNFTFIIGSVLGYLFSMAKMFFNQKDSE